MPTIKLPQVGKTMQSGTVRRWLKKPGDIVAKGELILELDCDSGIVEIESPVDGRLREYFVGEGKTAAVHAALAAIDNGSGSAEVGSAAPLTSSGQVASGAAVSPDSGKPQPAKGAGPAGATTGAIPTTGVVTPILMPKAGQSMEEGVLVKWHVKPGAVIKKGDVIFEIETDKANMDVEAPESGRLARIVLAEGGSSPVLLPVAYLAENDADVDAFIAAGGGPASGSSAAAGANAAGGGPAAATQPAAPARTSAVSSAAVHEGGRVKASPAARKIADERGIDLATIATGTGPGGRIISSDVPMSAPSAAAKQAGTPAAAQPGEKRKRMSQMRKAIARNLLLSKQTIPHFYVRLTIDAVPLVAYYQARKAQFPCSINDVIVMACARMIRDYPAFRSRIEGDEIVEAASANIGIAVGMDDGLVVPVMMGAERLTLQQIGAETKRLAGNARSGKIEGMGLGSFTITNLGMFGTEEFAAIINPPEAAILAVGAAREAVVVKDGALKAGKKMTMTLSADHRVIDGMLAAKFLQGLKELLESPEKLNG